MLQYLCLSSREYYLVCEYVCMSWWVILRHDRNINNKKCPPALPSPVLIFCRLQPETRKMFYRVFTRSSKRPFAGSLLDRVNTPLRLS